MPPRRRGIKPNDDDDPVAAERKRIERNTVLGSNKSTVKKTVNQKQAAVTIPKTRAAKKIEPVLNGTADVVEEADPAEGIDTDDEAAQAAKDAEKYLKNPKTAQDVEKGYRALQAELDMVAKEAFVIFANIKAAKGSGMSREKQEQLQKECESKVKAACSLFKGFNDYKTKVSAITANDRLLDRTAMLPINRNHVSDPLPRLIFEEHPFSRAKAVKKYNADMFTSTALRTLLDSTLAMAGADPVQARDMIDAWVDPSITDSEHDDPLNAIAALKTVSGIPVFVPGSRLEQVQRAVGEELFGVAEELKYTRDNLAKVMAEAAVKEVKPVVTKAPVERKKREVVVKREEVVSGGQEAGEAKPKEGRGAGRKKEGDDSKKETAGVKRERKKKEVVYENPADVGRKPAGAGPNGW